MWVMWVGVVKCPWLGLCVFCAQGMHLFKLVLLVDAALAMRPVDRYSASWATPLAGNPFGVPLGRPTPPDGPYAGNGDVTVMYTGDVPATGAHGVGWQQWLHLSKNDMWGSDSNDCKVMGKKGAFAPFIF